MSVNQAQVDHIITAASEDDPEVKLQNLEREVDLIKTSIKRLLMDIRERMNELENPFTLVASGNTGSAMSDDLSEAKKSAMEAREAALDARESQLDAEKAKMETEASGKGEGPVSDKPVSGPVTPEARDEKKIASDHLLSVLREQAAAHQKSATIQKPETEKTHLQKVYKLFRWTSLAVRKFGHDRVGIMLESYCVMGYIPRKTVDEIREISRLMPANLGEEQEVSPDDFVFQIYSLNRIIAPQDLSLDRDMIEVMMEQRQQQGLAAAIPGEDGSPGRIGLPGKKISSKTGEKDDSWMNLPV